MMKKLFDRYFFVLQCYFDRLYGKDVLSYQISGIMSASLTFNIFSFVILFTNNILSQNLLWGIGGMLIILAVLMIIIDTAYNKKRREKLRKEYKDESYESRRKGVVWVVVYEVLTVALCILAVFTTKPEV